MNEITLSILKPDAVSKNITGSINKMIEDIGLKIVAQKMVLLNEKLVKKFYDIHKDKPFFDDLVNYMLQGPVVLQVLSGDNAVIKYRNLMGATNPKDAAAGTIRATFSKSIDANTVHGSDSIENAAKEIDLFFKKSEIFT
ncbi:nucleoside diphosphate kinase [Candidatus Xenohaliotis californiensis]|uniref:Nucleoside diphosphate kinase n=1 Tax=Candidatus Xenohaliotis californiensis TaxID=84677 RepID=A0ABP0EU84_9RICK|nr:nucleoside diphosphate kinase [Candidatus Xenohaliotis californiensis]